MLWQKSALAVFVQLRVCGEKLQEKIARRGQSAKPPTPRDQGSRIKDRMVKENALDLKR
jgi:hypothetical protein